MRDSGDEGIWKDGEEDNGQGGDRVRGAEALIEG